MVKPSGPICNLNCEYCYYLEKKNLYQKPKSWIMDLELLQRHIQEYIASQSGSVVSFTWQGGEPTLCGLEYFEKIVEFQKKYSDGRPIENSLQTNGVLLDESWGDFLAENSFLVGLSIDGPEELHDFYRRDKKGDPTFKKALRGVRILKKHGVDFNTLTVVSRKNSYYPLQVYHFLKEIGSKHQQFIPLVERRLKAAPLSGRTLVEPQEDREAAVTDWSVEPAQFGAFLTTIFDEWVRKDVGSHFIQMFEVALESWFGLDQSLCIFSKTCGDSLVLESNGDLYACDHFVYPEHRLGNIRDRQLIGMIESKSQLEFGENKQKKLTNYCKECSFLFACNGDCPKHRFINFPNEEYGLSYLCEGYKRFFNHIAPVMKFMAEELNSQRSPANVMKWIKTHPLTSDEPSISKA
jgi:uncharacterized protein